MWCETTSGEGGVARAVVRGTYFSHAARDAAANERTRAKGDAITKAARLTLTHAHTLGTDTADENSRVGGAQYAMSAATSVTGMLLNMYAPNSSQRSTAAAAVYTEPPTTPNSHQRVTFSEPRNKWKRCAVARLLARHSRTLFTPSRKSRADASKAI